MVFVLVVVVVVVVVVWFYRVKNSQYSSANCWACSVALVPMENDGLGVGLPETGKMESRSQWFASHVNRGSGVLAVVGGFI